MKKAWMLLVAVMLLAGAVQAAEPVAAKALASVKQAAAERVQWLGSVDAAALEKFLQENRPYAWRQLAELERRKSGPETEPEDVREIEEEGRDLMTDLLENYRRHQKLAKESPDKVSLHLQIVRLEDRQMEAEAAYERLENGTALREQRRVLRNLERERDKLESQLEGEDDDEDEDDDDDEDEDEDEDEDDM